MTIPPDPNFPEQLMRTSVPLPDAKAEPAAPTYTQFNNQPLAPSWECGWCAALVADRDKHSQFHRSMWQVLG